MLVKPFSLFIKERNGLRAFSGINFTLALIAISGHIAFSDLQAQIRDHKGKEFFLAFLPNPIEPLTLQLSILSETETRVLVEYPVGTPLGDSLTIQPGETTIVNIPQSAGRLSSWPGHVFGQADDNCIRVSATQNVTCFMMNRNDASSDGGLAFPTDALHKNLVIMSYDVSHPSVGDAGVFAVVAPYDSTIITVTPVKNLEGGFAARQPVTVLLRRGEGFLAESAFGFFGPDSTLAGSFVKASNPVAVINGNKCTRVPIDDPSCDHVFEIAQSIQTWGKHVLVTALGGESIRPAGAIYRILTAAPSTTVFLDGQPLGTINESQFLNTDTLKGAHVFTADNPIFVSQFMTSRVTSNSASADPSMVNMIPTEQFANAYNFAIPMNAQGTPLFEKNLFTVVVKNEDIGIFTHNGAIIPAQEFSEIQNSGFSTATIEIQQNAFHTTASDSGHNVIAWGFSNDNSYIFPAGARLDIINPLDDQPPEISIEFREEAPNTVFGFVMDSKTGGIGARDTLLYGGEASGIRRIFLSDSLNASLDSLNFTPGDPTGTFTLRLQDPTQPGKAMVEVIDESENRALLEVFIPVCVVKITEPANNSVTFEEQVLVNVLATFATLGGDGLASFDKLDTIFVNNEIFTGADLNSTDTSFSAIVPLEIGQNMILSKRMYHHRLHETDPSKPITACTDTIFVTRVGVQELACVLTISNPENGSFVTDDSILVTAILKVGGGVFPVRDSCTVNGQPVKAVNDTIAIKLPLSFGENPIDIFCAITDSIGQKASCSRSIIVVRATAPTCEIVILSPRDSAIVFADSIQVIAVAKATGGVPPFSDSCTVNGLLVPFRNGAFSINLPLELGNNPIRIACTFSDAIGQQTTCSSEITVERKLGPVCEVTILEPLDQTITFDDSVLVLATAKTTGGNPPFSDSCTVNDQLVSLSTDTIQIKLPLDFGQNPITVSCTFTDSNGQKTSCEASISVIRPSPPECAISIIQPQDGATILADSVLFLATAKVVGGIAPYADSCFVNGQRVVVRNDTIAVKLPLAIGENRLLAVCTFTDALGQQTKCETEISVIRPNVPICTVKIIQPVDGAVLADDSVFVKVEARSTGGALPYADSICTIIFNSESMPVSHLSDGSFSATIPLSADSLLILAMCTFTDASGQQTVCADSVTVFRAEPLSCSLTILSPIGGEVFIGDSVRVTAIAGVSGGINPTHSRCTINDATTSIDGDTLRASVALNPGLNTITASCTFTDINGNNIFCEQTIQVKKDVVSCDIVYLSPSDSAAVCTDSLFVSAIVQITGGFQPVQKVCTINGMEIMAANDTLAAKVKLEPGRNVIIASCVFTDIVGQTITCTDSVVVFHDVTPPGCDFQTKGGGISGTITDAGSGIASIKTDYLNNGTLIVDRFRPGDKIVSFRIEPKNPEKPIGFNINVTDVCGNRFLCDPVYLHIEADGGRQHVIHFPSIDRYLYLTNHGLQEIRIDLNGKKFTFVTGASPSQPVSHAFQIPHEGTVVFDLQPCLLEAVNKMVIEVNGPAGSSADLLIMAIAREVEFVLSYQEPLPIAFRLLQNYPNPFNPETFIPIEIPSGWSHPVAMQIYDTSGRLIKTVADGYLPAGISMILWDGTDVSGEQVASGVYFYRVVSGEVVQVRKLILVR